MSCTLCPNPALCNPVCRAFDFAPAAVRAQMREACAASGQMTAQEVSAHVEAGEMNQCDGCMQRAPMRGKLHIDEEGRAFMACERDKYAVAPKGEAGEMEAAKGDELAD